LTNKYALFHLASLGTVISSKDKAYDAGQTFYYCYLWDFNSNKYKPVFLADIGVSTSYNSDPSAVELLNWLGVEFAGKKWRDWVSEQGTK